MQLWQFWGGMFDEIPMIEEILSRAYDARD